MKRWQAKLAAVLGPVASLRLTVVLFAMSMVVIFAGTLAQQFDGNWRVIDQYFRSFVVWIPFALFIPGSGSNQGPALPFPAGTTLIIALLINLCAAHLVRFRISIRRAGILIIHAGLILLLVGELITGAYANEGQMTIQVGSYAQHIDDIREVELAFVNPTDPEADQHVVVPQAMLERAASHRSLIEDPRLPFVVQVDHFVANSALIDLAALEQTDEPPSISPLMVGVGRDMAIVDRPPITGVDTQRAETPSAYITLLAKTDRQPICKLLVSANLRSRQALPGESPWQVQLRFKREYKPYRVHLENFEHRTYVGTNTPSWFASHVRVVEPDSAQQRPAVISMNNPLRYRGSTFYQMAYLPQNTGTVLQVVRNPGWLLPYVSCALVGLGLLWHFGSMLLRFVQRQEAGR